ncbi:MAG TPA: hypothetical protein VNU19_04945 [Candidatus Acidoferrum sp.]|nr:hypothetical protein [Candidatus Acidoferrum sp.]
MRPRLSGDAHTALPPIEIAHGEGSDIAGAQGQACQEQQRGPGSQADGATRRVPRQPRRAASMVAMSIFFIGIIASKARFASPPPAESASMSTRGVICQKRPQRSLHHPH